MCNSSDFECPNESSPNSSCHFWSTGSGFIQILHHRSVSWKITPLYFFKLKPQILWTKIVYRRDIFGLLNGGVKLTKFLMSFLEPRVSFSSNFASLFSFMEQNSSVLFHLNLYMLCTKGSDQRANFQTFDYSHENHLNSLCYFFKLHVNFPLNFTSHFSVMTHNFFQNFLTETYAFNKKSPSMYNFSDFWVL